MDKIPLYQLQRELNIRPLTEEQIRHLFAQLDEIGWTYLESHFDNDRSGIVDVFVEIIIRRDQAQ